MDYVSSYRRCIFWIFGVWQREPNKERSMPLDLSGDDFDDVW